jgi:two-component system alkaline phosphatase synthesis response regulator PhoP
MGHRILLVEDDPLLASALTAALVSDGYAVDNIANSSAAIAFVIDEPFDLVLLDADRSCSSGIEVCRELRARGIRTPIIILTGRNRVPDRILGLQLGADDYVVKPFDTGELLARIHAVLRRWRDLQQAVLAEYRFGSVFVDFLNGNVLRRGQPVNLSTKELRLLRHLIAHRRETQPRKDLLREVWGYLVETTRTLDVHIAALRQKLEDNPRKPRHILTVRREGYVFRD